MATSSSKFVFSFNFANSAKSAILLFATYRILNFRSFERPSNFSSRLYDSHSCSRVSARGSKFLRAFITFRLRERVFRFRSSFRFPMVPMLFVDSPRCSQSGRSFSCLSILAIGGIIPISVIFFASFGPVNTDPSGLCSCPSASSGISSSGAPASFFSAHSLAFISAIAFSLFIHSLMAFLQLVFLDILSDAVALWHNGRVLEGEKPDKL
mmetsp:Transcript_24228/g.39059  ORF Transcript_24228/g.39059 Transcript_24228/m.39059 type:complete len:210 (+) Transcript_24228:43-672(+)